MVILVANKGKGLAVISVREVALDLGENLRENEKTITFSSNYMNL